MEKLRMDKHWMTIIQNTTSYSFFKILLLLQIINSQTYKRWNTKLKPSSLPLASALLDVCDSSIFLLVCSCLLLPPTPSSLVSGLPSPKTICTPRHTRPVFPSTLLNPLRELTSLWSVDLLNPRWCDLRHRLLYWSYHFDYMFFPFLIHIVISPLMILYT